MKCEICNTEITFWMALKQPTPFRFKCSNCKTKYRVSTPRMKAVFVVMCVLFFGFGLGLALAAHHFGIIYAAPLLIPMIVIWFALELWTHHCISARGTLTRIEIPRD